MNEKYRESIKDMIDKIESEKILQMIYGYTYTGYREEKAGQPAQPLADLARR